MLGTIIHDLVMFGVIGTVAIFVAYGGLSAIIRRVRRRLL